MDAKKTPKADLETKRMLFVQFGLVIALFLVFVAFEYKSYDERKIETGTREAIDIVEEIIPVTEQKVQAPPPPPPTVTTVINIVEDEVEVATEIEIDAEATQKTEIAEYVPIQMEEEVEVKEDHIFTIVEADAEYPGGEKARMEFLSKNIRYPTMARESGIQGRVHVTFVVEKDGSVTDVVVTRGIGGGCDEEAVRVVRLMPKWIPGKQRNKPVRVQFNLPIKFTLQ